MTTLPTGVTDKRIPIVDPKTGNEIAYGPAESSTSTSPLGGSSGGGSSVGRTNGAASGGKPELKMEEQCPKAVCDEIVSLVEYIFGSLNLPYDFYYLTQAEQLEPQFHAVPLSYVLNNPRLKRLTASPAVVRWALEHSALVMVRCTD
eukprot:RCo045367